MNTIQILELLAAISTILGTALAWGKGWIRLFYYILVIKIFNRKSSSLNLSLINKFNEKPQKLLDFNIFQKIKNNFDPDTEIIKKLAIRKESMRIKIFYKKYNYDININIRIDEEPKLESLSEEEPEILHYNLIIKLTHYLKINWQDIKSLDIFTSSFTKIDSILQQELFRDMEIEQKYYSCDIFRNFKIGKIPKKNPEDEEKETIVINKKNINIIGVNLLYLKDLIKKYYLS